MSSVSRLLGGKLRDLDTHCVRALARAQSDLNRQRFESQEQSSISGPP